MIYRYCALALIVAPLGPAAQNCFTLLLLLAVLVHVVTGNGRVRLKQQLPLLKPYIFSSVILLSCFLGSDLYWQYVPLHKMLEYTGGYLSILIFPIAGSLFLPRLRDSEFTKLKTILLVVMVIMSFICLSQFLFGWQWRSVQFAPSELRARGFYSHPLTLAYAALLLLPFCWQETFPEKTINHTKLPLLASLLLTIFVSKSRIVQLATIVYASTKTAIQFRSRQRLVGIFLIFLTCGIIALTPNPIRDNFSKTLAGNNDHEAISYPDDRVLFWHAHTLLALDSLLIGHSPHAPQSLRDEKYEYLGFSTFKKKYSAHNTFLQIVVDAGLIGLVAFGFWLASVYQLAGRVVPSKRKLALETIIIFMICSLSQNSWQDIEVRFIISILLASIFMKSE